MGERVEVVVEGQANHLQRELARPARLLGEEVRVQREDASEEAGHGGGGDGGSAAGQVVRDKRHHFVRELLPLQQPQQPHSNLGTTGSRPHLHDHCTHCLLHAGVLAGRP